MCSYHMVCYNLVNTVQVIACCQALSEPMLIYHDMKKPAGKYNFMIISLDTSHKLIFSSYNISATAATLLWQISILFLYGCKWYCIKIPLFIHHIQNGKQDLMTYCCTLRVHSCTWWIIVCHLHTATKIWVFMETEQSWHKAVIWMSQYMISPTILHYLCGPL